MAITQNTYTGNGSTVLYSFTFPYLETSDIKVSVNGTNTTAYTLANATTIQFNAAPANGAAIRIYRETDDSALAAQFYPGSAIRSSDLNDNFTQNLYVTQESSNNAATATSTANTALTNSNTAISTANTALSTANTASTNASAAVTTANTASTNASAAVSTANTASSNATAAVNTANSAASDAATALSTANTALSTANTASTNATAAVSTANTASTNASAAVTTANTASSNATTAVSTANTAASNASTALSTANTAISTANAAASAVANAILYDTVANVAAIPASPANNDAVEVVNSTGIESFSPLSGRPAGFVGDSGLSVRMVYTTTGATWNWIQYFPNDPEARYGDAITTLQTDLNTAEADILALDSAKLDATTAASTYLTQANAASTYQTQAGMSSYLTTTAAGTTYAPLASPTFTGRLGLATTTPAATAHIAGSTIISNVNVASASYDSISFSIAGEETAPTGIFFSPDGRKMFVIGSTGDDINEYTLSTPWNVSTATYVTVFSVSAQDTTPQDLYFRNDGKKLYVIGNASDSIYQYTLATPWSIATASYDSVSFSVATEENTPAGLRFRPDGLALYVVGTANDAIYRYNLSTAWNVSTATLASSFLVGSQETLPNALDFSADGSRMFVMGTTGDDVNIYDLTSPWDITTASFVTVFSVAGQETGPTGLYVKPDGTKFYIVGSINDTVYQYTIPSATIGLTGTTNINGSAEVAQDLTIRGDATISSGQLSVPLGSAARPSIDFDTDTDTGIFSPTANTFALSTGGTERARIDSSGRLLLGTTSGSGRLTVAGNAVGVVSALTDGATITPDFSLANNFSVTLGGNRTLANPSNLTAGQAGTIVITQDGTGSRTLAFGSNWKFPGGTAPTLTTTASAVDVIAYYVESATRITARLIADVK